MPLTGFSFRFSELRDVSLRKRPPEVMSVSSFLLFILMPLSLSCLSGLTSDRCGAPDVLKFLCFYGGHMPSSRL